MGSWNATPFGNDSALDWFADLERQEDVRAFLASTLDRVGSEESADAAEAEQAIAAAAIITAAAENPPGAIHADAKRWIVLVGFAPEAQLVEQALRAIAQVRAGSELRELWQEAGALKSWHRQLDTLTGRLQKARDAGLPSRSPKAEGTPRSLHKLLALYARQPDVDVRKKIRAKVDAMKDPNKATADTDFQPPLLLMARHGLLAETLQLLAAGADPNRDRIRPFVHACTAGHIDVAKALHAAGAVVFHEHRFSPEHGVALQFDVTDPNQPIQGHRYCLALFSVARSGSGSIEVLEYLTELGADILQTDLNGETLLHKAAESGCIPMLEYLIDNGLNPNQAKGESGDTPLHYAARAGQTGAVRTLLALGADPNAISRFDGEEHQWQESPLDITESPEVRELLLAHGARKG